MDSKGKGKKSDRKNEKEKKMDSDKVEITNVTPIKGSQNSNEDAGDSASSTDSEELVNAINYNTITSLAALKDIIQGDNTDTPETDTFFQHYFMNHCNNLSSRNSNSASPFPYTERRRLSQCREEDEDDEKKDCNRRYASSSINTDSNTVNLDSDVVLPPKREIMNIDTEKNNKDSNNLSTDSKTSTVETEDISERTVMGAKHKFLVTKTEQMTTPVARALRNQVNNAHTVHFGTKGAEEQRPNVRTIFTGKNLHHDKNYFDSSLIEIRSTVDGVLPSAEDIWVKRTEEKH
ncbi:jg20404, partial [Pararge aegeria aegeria]